VIHFAIHEIDEVLGDADVSSTIFLIIKDEVCDALEHLQGVFANGRQHIQNHWIGRHLRYKRKALGLLMICWDLI
jgi:hypothetical protein